MDINGTIDRTFFNNGVELHAPKIITPKIARHIEIPGEQDDNFYSNFLQKIKNEDFKAPNNMKPRKSSQFCANMLQIPGKSSFKDFAKSPRKSVENISFCQEEEEVAKSSNLKPRKLKTDTNNASNMLLVIPGMAGHQNSNKNNSSFFGHRRKSHASHIKLNDLRDPFEQQSRNSESSQKDGHRRKSHASHIKLQDLRDPFEQQSRNSEASQKDLIIKDTDSNNKSKVLKIMIPQITKFREFSEEMNKLEIQPNIIEIEVIGTKKPLPFRPFIFDSLKIQKLNSINELSTKQQDNDDLHKSMVILNQMKGSKINPEHILKQKESQIIIINQNEFQRFPSNKSNNKESKRLFCCIPVK